MHKIFPDLGKITEIKYKKFQTQVFKTAYLNQHFDA